MFVSQVSADRMMEIHDTPVAEGAEAFQRRRARHRIRSCGALPTTKKEVLHDVSFTAKEGEVTALVGPSGFGKEHLRTAGCETVGR